MATECAAAAADLATGRPRKRARLGWDVAPAAEAQIGTFCGQEVGDVASLLFGLFGWLVLASPLTQTSQQYFLTNQQRTSQQFRTG